MEPLSTRPPAVAGAFYSQNGGDLAASIETYLYEAASENANRLRPKALIVPHAGYVYSGPIAASAYRLILPWAKEITRVVLLGPCHRVAVRGMALSTARHFSTPLGDIPIDPQQHELVERFSFVGYSDAAHAQEHSLEVQLPFLQEVLDDFTLVPIACGQATTDEVAAVIDAEWGGPETLIVVSSDLSHYHDYETARRMDQRTTHAIEALDPAALGHDQACGLVPVRGLLQTARARQLHCTTLDLRNSGDTAGPRDQVVGYGAYAFA